MPQFDVSPWGRNRLSLLAFGGLTLLLLLMTGCSDRTYVANYVAEHHYQLARYNHECGNLQLNDPKREQFRTDVNEWKRQEEVASEVTAIGKLPSQEKKEMRTQAKKVRQDTCSH